MNKGFITGMVLLLIISGLLFFYNSGLSKKDNLSSDGSNISIMASYDGQDAITGYMIDYGSGIISGNTSKGSYEVVSIPKNVTVRVTNKNLDGQNFYVEEKNYSIINDNIRVDFILKKAEEVNVTISDVKPLSVNLYSKNYRNIKVCLKSSFNYIFVKPLNLKEIDKIKGYESWDGCYDTNASLENSNMTLLIDYTTFSTPNNNDYINLAIISEMNNKIIELK